MKFIKKMVNDAFTVHEKPYYHMNMIGCVFLPGTMLKN